MGFFECHQLFERLQPLRRSFPPAGADQGGAATSFQLEIGRADLRSQSRNAIALALEALLQRVGKVAPAHAASLRQGGVDALGVGLAQLPPGGDAANHQERKPTQNAVDHVLIG